MPTLSSGFDHLRPRDFDRLSKFIHGYCGIKLPPSKRTMLEGRLRRRLRETGLPDLATYCNFLFEKGGLDEELVHLIDVVTTNKTEFFREPSHFQFLAQTAVPRLLAARRTGSVRPLKLWSAACSNGAEPYTLAMVMAELGLQRPELQSTIIATDICTEVLEAAILGIYPAAMAESIPLALRQRYMMKSKISARAQVRVVPGLRRQVQFGRLNLMDEVYPVGRDIDVIFCRNILIYFDRPTQELVLQNLCNCLNPGGYLFLGHSESLADFVLPLAPVGNTIFRRL